MTNIKSGVKWKTMCDLLRANGCPDHAIKMIEDEMQGLALQVPTVAGRLIKKRKQRVAEMVEAGNLPGEVARELGISRQAAHRHIARCKNA